MRRVVKYISPLFNTATRFAVILRFRRDGAAAARWSHNPKVASSNFACAFTSRANSSPATGSTAHGSVDPPAHAHAAASPANGPRQPRRQPIDVDR